MSELYKQALDYLARREHSALELKQKLKAKGDADEVEVLLQQLSQFGVQSDARFTESYVRARAAAGIGPRRIEQELKQRGVSDALIAEYLCQEDDFWWDNLQQVWQKKYHDGLAKGDRKEYARQARFLAQRGFDQNMIINLLKSKAENCSEEVN